MERSERLSFSPYAPIRYQDDFWWEFALKMGRERLIFPDGSLAPFASLYVDDRMVQPTLRRLHAEMAERYEDPVVRDGELTLHAHLLLSLQDWVLLAGQYILCGRQIFDLNDEVVELLEHTDFQDCTLEDWQPTYDAFFIRFGARDSVRLDWKDESHYLDGAFIAVAPSNEDGAKGAIKIGLTTIGKDGRGAPLPSIYLEIHPEDLKLPIPNAIENAITRRMNSYKDMNKGEVKDDPLILGVSFLEQKRMTASAEMITKATALIVNTLFYIESIGSNRTLEPGRDAPTDYTVQWGNATVRQREKLKSRLLSNGYTPVYSLGRELSLPAASNGHGGAKRAHWRRGHWRRQPHGPARALVKRIWVKPQMIGADRVHDDLPGHIYAVGNHFSPDTQH